jgi:hypothetical protein
VVLTQSELVLSLQKEVRILLHLAGKIDRAQLDYRPTPKQRSILELLKYLTNMGPMLLRHARGEKVDESVWGPLLAEAEARDFDQTLAALAAHNEAYAALVGGMSDDMFRAEVAGFDGRPISAGAFIVNQVLGQCIAYRTQLFLYLKACGREELNTMNLWVGVDAPMPV